MTIGLIEAHRSDDALVDNYVVKNAPGQALRKRGSASAGEWLTADLVISLFNSPYGSLVTFYSLLSYCTS